MCGGGDSLVLVLHTYLKCSDPSIYNDGFDNNAHNIHTHTHTHTHLYDESHESLFSLPRHSLFILSSYSLRSLFALSSLSLLYCFYRRLTNGSNFVAILPHVRQRRVDLSCPAKMSTTTLRLRTRYCPHASADTRSSSRSSCE